MMFRLPKLELLLVGCNGRCGTGVDDWRLNNGDGTSEARRRSLRSITIRRAEFSSMGNVGTVVQVNRCAVGRLSAMLSRWAVSTVLTVDVRVVELMVDDEPSLISSDDDVSSEDKDG